MDASWITNLAVAGRADAEEIGGWAVQWLLAQSLELLTY